MYVLEVVGGCGRGEGLQPRRRIDAEPVLMGVLVFCPMALSPQS